MYKGQTVAVVVPAYNEAGLVGEVIDTMPDLVDRAYVIDDCSTDGTWEEIRRHAALANGNRPRAKAAVNGEATGEFASEATGEFASESTGDFVVPIRKESNGGRGSCVTLGYRRALEDGFDVVAVMDGDGQMDPAVLDRILDPVVEGWADYAKGDRMHHRHTREGMSQWRAFGNALLSFLTKLSSGYWQTSDSQNGYTAISRQALERIPFEDLYDDYGFLNDVLTTLNVHQMRVANVPHEAVYGDEQSTIKYRTFVPKLSSLLLRNFVRRVTQRYMIQNFHPVVFCYLFGVLGLGAGLVGGTGTLAGLAGGQNVVVGGLLSTLVALLGGAILSMAMILDVEQNEELSQRGVPTSSSSTPQRASTEEPKSRVKQ
jgi:glycosyltransferase involved in cell wall biosynthesis